MFSIVPSNKEQFLHVCRTWLCWYDVIVSTGVAIMNYPFYVIAKLQE